MALGKPMKGGGTYRDHLRAAERPGMQIPELDPPEFAPGFRPLWEVFWSMRRGAGKDAMGNPQGISPESMVAWQQLRNVELTPWEVETIEVLDQAYLDGMREQKNVGDGR